MILPLRRYFDFTGRSRRMEFWMFQLLNLGVSLVWLAIMFAGFPWELMDPEAQAQFNANVDSPEAFFTIFGPLFWIGAGLGTIWGLGTFIPQLAVTVRRLHDRGHSGWWYGGLLIAGVIPLVSVLVLPGYIVLLVFLFLDGEPGANKWGDNPKHPGQPDVFA